MNGPHSGEMHHPLVGLVALCLIPGVGGVTLRALLDRFGDVDSILAASADNLRATPGVGPRTAAAIRAVNVEQTATEMAFWQGEGIAVLDWGHPAYPALLRPLHSAPPVLFCRGVLAVEDSQAVGLVGTRTPTPQSRQFAENAGYELARRGWTVVSGLAWGVDYAAHSGALRAGRTIAILGSGLSVPLPPDRQRLAGRIRQSGALLSEVHPDTPPHAAALVARNRLISGLSRATIVIEAEKEGGSLHTARFAREQNRALFAVHNGQAGNTALIRDGALPLPPDLTDWDALHERLKALS